MRDDPVRIIVHVDRRIRALHDTERPEQQRKIDIQRVVGEMLPRAYSNDETVSATAGRDARTTGVVHTFCQSRTETSTCFSGVGLRRRAIAEGRMYRARERPRGLEI